VDVQARSETAFAARALRTDPRFDVTQLLLPAARSAPPPDWKAYDVIVFGPIPSGRIGVGPLHDLADAVTTRGIGLLLAGGRDVFNDIFYARSDLLAISPVNLSSVRPVDEYRPAFLPTEAGLRHPIFQTAAAANNAKPAQDPLAPWRALPLGSAARLG